MFKKILSRLASSPQTESAAEAEAGTPVSSPAATILLVDDDNILRNLVKVWLEARNYRVITASNGREGVERAGREQPDAIILDGSMPEMDGFEALKHIRRNRTTARTPVIMLTMRVREGDVLTGFRYGAQQYLTKPVSADEIANALKEVLRQSR